MEETPAEKRRASKKGKVSSETPDNESDKVAVKDVRQQGERITAFLDSLQQTQTQQLAMMNQFTGAHL